MIKYSPLPFIENGVSGIVLIALPGLSPLISAVSFWRFHFAADAEVNYLVQAIANKLRSQIVHWREH